MHLALSELFHVMESKQHLTQPTHQACGNVDLVVKFSNFDVDDLK